LAKLYIGTFAALSELQERHGYKKYPQGENFFHFFSTSPILYFSLQSHHYVEVSTLPIHFFYRQPPNLFKEAMVMIESSFSEPDSLPVHNDILGNPSRRMTNSRPDDTQIQGNPSPRTSHYQASASTKAAMEKMMQEERSRTSQTIPSLSAVTRPAPEKTSDADQ
jgi:hypothetical protein